LSIMNTSTLVVRHDRLGLWRICWPPRVGSSQMNQLTSVWWRHRCDNYLRLRPSAMQPSAMRVRWGSQMSLLSEDSF